MSDITLLIMAAGMGSRYGGLKQLDPVGPNNETIIDYSIYDAIQAGFNKAVFIIREEFKSEFENSITNKYRDKINVKLAFQKLDDLPGDFSHPAGREKPWGTGQAILAAEKMIDEPFAVINGDDFYGKESFQVVADYYKQSSNFSMVAFKLLNTLSDHGGVSRGVCEVKDNHLSNIIETHDIIREGNEIKSSGKFSLAGDEFVSMNMWGFTPKLFEYLNEGFSKFLSKHSNELKSEYLIPSVVNNLIQTDRKSVHILHSSAKWFGVTYKEDKSYVMEEIKRLIKDGHYPKKLFSEFKYNLTLDTVKFTPPYLI